MSSASGGLLHGPLPICGSHHPARPGPDPGGLLGWGQVLPHTTVAHASEGKGNQCSSLCKPN